MLWRFLFKAIQRLFEDSCDLISEAGGLAKLPIKSLEEALSKRNSILIGRSRHGFARGHNCTQRKSYYWLKTFLTSPTLF